MGKSQRLFIMTLAVICAAISVNGSFMLMLLLVMLVSIVLARQSRGILATVFLTTFILSHLFIAYDLNEQSKLRPKQQLFDVILMQPLIDGDRLSAVAIDRDTGERMKYNYTIRSQDEKQRLRQQLTPGLICQMHGTLEKPRPPTNFQAFHYPDYLQHQEIYWLLSGDHPPKCRDNHSNLITTIKQMRYQSILKVSDALPADIAGVVNALIFGYRETFDPDVLQAYQSSGLIHLLAVSGLHVGIMIGIIYFGMLRLGVIKQHAALILCVLLPIYVILTGFSPSVLRASLMFGSLLMVKILSLRWTPFDVLCMVFLFLTVINPDMIFNVGFQLSFLVTFAIIISAPIIDHRYKSTMMKSFVITSISQAVALPILVFHFYEISLLSYLLNLLFIPFITLFVLPMALMIVGLGFIPPLQHLVVVMLQGVVTPLHDLLLAIQDPVFQLTFGQPSLVVLVIMIGSVYIALVLWDRFNRLLTMILPLLATSCLFGLIILIHLLSPEGQITFIDVGQGDAILIQVPHNQGNILIDTGGTLPYSEPDWKKRRDPFNVGEDILVPELKGLGINHLDYVILSHPDYDHTGALGALLEQISVETLVISQHYKALDGQMKVFEQAKKAGVQLKTVSAGDQLQMGHIVFSFIASLGQGFSDNDRSLVIRAQIAGMKWLFTGDLEKKGEQKLLASRRQIKADVLKVGHHGSKTSTSTAFLKTINPKLAIISVGRHNLYGHPSKEVIERLQKQGVHVLRTDRDGAVRLRFAHGHIRSINTAVP
ncbi:DNA internalization-related competence protein ComEC/Rec2 [Tuberibacillus sp. Marseille-P3662]|uniref:DNA internalization-related competence protein ComEC/Rec2 n=1 Tax=Tuberibacillus sp. Marseille-P3662 TaxID=1965358 RepID=UPI000A1CEDEB|nr:DNA internalization-related competence protein ComEC/Rec2 [Tuberibacillus sp. Marseille-P3662]